MGKRKYKPLIFQSSKKLKSMSKKLRSKYTHTGNKMWLDKSKSVGNILNQRHGK